MTKVRHSAMQADKPGYESKIKWLARFWRKFPLVVFALLVLTPIQAMVDVAIPRMVGYTVDFLQTETVTDDWLAKGTAGLGARLGFDPITAFALAFIAVGFIAVALYGSFQGLRAWMNCRLEWEFRQDAFNGITEKGPDFFQKFRIGDLVTRLTDDVAEKLSWFACSGIFRLYEAVCRIAFILAMMIWIDPILTLWTAGPLPVLIAIYMRSGSVLDKRYDALQKCISAVNDRTEACFSGIRVVKSYVREEAQQREFGAVARARRIAEIASVRAMTVIESLWHSVWQFGVVIVLFAGGYRVLHAGLTVGELATFLYYVVWLVFPMFDVGQFVVKSRQSAVSIERLQGLERVEPMVSENGGAAGLDGAPASIRFRDVDFTLPGADRNMLEEIDIEIAAGETVAVVGRVGCGKSWLVNLIPRLVDPVTGSVEIGGRDARELNLTELRAMVGYVPQDPVLFSETVRANIEFGREGIDTNLLDWALEVSQFKPDVERFPKREDTRIGTRGVALSGGQKQRLALARALAGKPRILVLDDCTSALDSRTETALWDRLQEVMPDLTAILITHRTDTLQRVDRIFVLERGRLVESGTHDELIAAGGEYATIYRRYELEEMVN